LLHFVSDGQSIAERISRQISNTMAKLRKVVKSYNAVVTSEEQILLPAAASSSSALYTSIVPYTYQKTSIPASVMQKAVELKCREDRASEEIDQIKSEMLCVQSYYKNQLTALKDTLTTLHGELMQTAISGALSLLYKKCNEMSYFSEQSAKYFSKYIEDNVTQQHDEATTSAALNEYEIAADSQSDLCEDSAFEDSDDEAS
jgi:hypothetical protein